MQERATIGPDGSPSNASPSNALPVAVIGCGRMGRFHAGVYSKMTGSAALVGVYDANPAAAARAAAEYGVEPFTDLAAVLKRAKAVSIATPTTSHRRVAEQVINAGVPCLIEKPLAQDVADARALADLARRSGVTVQVGHIERFNPAIRAMGRLNIQPRFIEVIRISPMSFRSIDVGVVLDMMIHDIDIVLKLAGSTVKRIDASGVAVIGDFEDMCNARIVFANGCVANLVASRLALKTERKLRAFSNDAYVSIDYQKKYGMVARRGPDMAAAREAVAAIRRGEIHDLSDLNKSELVELEELAIDDVEPLRAELESFLAAVQTGTKPEVSAEDGLAAVETAAGIVEAIGKD